MILIVAKYLFLKKALKIVLPQKFFKTSIKKGNGKNNQ